MTQPYPKRLIEVDLPIARISAHARREKSIRHGHISTLHIWWARRPLAACRAVICASLWPDPSDTLCPQAFRETAVEQIRQFAARAYPKKITGESKELQQHGSPESLARWEAIAAGNLTLNANEPVDMPILRMCLLDFIADFANWDNSTVPAYLDISRVLTQVAHEALGGVPGTRPLVVDPFAGGGSIPLEALRVGADAFASDLNPVAVLLNKVILEYIPKYGQRLADEVRKWGKWVKEQAEQELAEFYPKDPDGATPMAYLWARTIRCEGPTCGVKVPLIRSLWISKKESKSVALRLIPESNKSEIAIEVLQNAKARDVAAGTTRRGSATCPVCEFTISADRVRAQFKGRQGGTADARMLAVVTSKPQLPGRHYRNVVERDLSAAFRAADHLDSKDNSNMPGETLPYLRSIFNIQLLDVTQWRHLFSPRQLLTVSCFSRLVMRAHSEMEGTISESLAIAVTTCLGLAVDRLIDKLSSLARWDASRENPQGTFGRQALPIVWDFNEINPFSGSGGDWDTALEWVAMVLERESKSLSSEGHAETVSATAHVLPDDSAAALVTDPPYYDAVPYADLSDFFYVWLRRSIGSLHPNLFEKPLSPKELEVVQLAERNELYAYKTRQNFEELMQQALSEGRRVVAPTGIGIVVFAHKETTAWEVMLQAVIDSGWVIAASWPIDTEMGNRLRAMNSATLTSSVHLVCRPRENLDGSLREETGEWRNVLAELPERIHEWMPRLSAEGIVGADAIFACLGPALEIFSRYSRVEKASGEAVPLREYLEQVWAAVSTAALSMIFKDADAAGLEPDARLTAMWLWTLGAGAGESNGQATKGKITASTGYTLEFDAARKIAQGLGIHLEKSESIVEIKGDKARMLPVSERTRYFLNVARNLIDFS